MKLTVLGSCSGTEPQPRRHHTSVAVETGGRLFYVDAGENCGYSSYLAGIDQSRTQAVFITHTHMDHVGGLPHLLWNLRKLCTISPEAERAMAGRVIPVVIPDLSSYEGVKAMLLASEGNYETVFQLEPRLLRDGVAYSQDGAVLTAFHNLHLGDPGPGKPWRSYSFLWEAEGKKVLFSGDFRDMAELSPHLDGVDLAFFEDRPPPGRRPLPGAPGLRRPGGQGGVLPPRGGDPGGPGRGAGGRPKGPGGPGGICPGRLCLPAVKGDKKGRRSGRLPFPVLGPCREAVTPAPGRRCTAGNRCRAGR